MDPVSHVVWGIVVTNLLPAPDSTLPRVAIASAAAVVPDLDFVTKFFKNIYFLKYHHSVTHSFLAVAATGVVIAWLGCLIFPGIGFWESYLVALVAGASHCALDLIMHGAAAMVFWPFSRRMLTGSLLLGLNPKTSHARCHEKSLRVCTVCQLHSAVKTPMMRLGFLAALASTFAGPLRFALALAGAIFGLLYLCLCYLQKRKVRRIAAGRLPAATDFRAFPADFSPFEWLAVCTVADGFGLLWLNSRVGKPRASRTFPKSTSSLAVERSKSTKTVREFLSACIVPWVFTIDDGDTVRVQWQDLSYALCDSIDFYAARITMRRGMSVIDEDFRERWPDVWRAEGQSGRD